jgi:molybdopterin converting factor small subunit
VKVQVKLFGPEARAAGRPSIDLEIPRLPISCAALRRRLAETEPKLTPLLASARFAVNCDFAGEETMIEPGAEVALIGSVSGG